MGVHFMRKARIADGKRDEALAFAADITDHWNETYATNVTWGLEVGGDVGTVYWMTDYESLAAMEIVMQASMVNEETRKRTREGVGLFATPPQDKIIYTM